MKRIITLNTEQKNKFFNLLIELHFIKKKMNSNTVFELGKTLLVYPEKVRIHHLIFTRKQLDINGILSAENFHLKLGLKQIGDKYFFN
jgi:hypothetical protein